ncbi:hypothetical protein BGZ63DRAFT_399292 [Mariannaea sp. PMI_226]|nr:hypothetical protein BGZ63DRAFT_399292 [Mariannaea sp. PMI_226]
MEQWRQTALAQRGQYEDRVKEQIKRSFQEYTPPWYASFIGFRRDWNLLVATSRVSGFASTLGRDLEDSETKAIAEYTLDNIHTNAACKWLTIGLAAYMTYRGRHTWQFPFYKPKLGGKFNPNEATSIFSNKKIRGAYPRFTWHTLRFTAYAAVTMLMVEPVFRAVNFIRTESAMAKDPRLETFIKEATSKVERVMADGPLSRESRHQRQAGSSAASDALPEYQTQETDYGDQSKTHYQENKFETGVPSQGWANVSPPSSTSQQPQSSNSGWGVLDEDDDASPIAASARNQSMGTASGGSAWDRLRQQSQSGKRPQDQSEFQSRGGWAGVGRANSQQQQSESQSGWGSAGSSSPEWGSKDKYSYSSGDGDRSSEKDQAQREFDEMLERERSNNEQSRPWGR